MWLLVILITLQSNEESENRVINSQYHMFQRESECREIAKKVRGGDPWSGDTKKKPIVSCFSFGAEISTRNVELCLEQQGIIRKALPQETGTNAHDLQNH